MGKIEPNIISIIGAPRTGSTLLYQLMVNLFDTFYFINYINSKHHECPAISATEINSYWKNPRFVPYKNTCGKTEGEYGPSEASNIFRFWFGGIHPSESNSAKILSKDKEQHMMDTMQILHQILGKSIVVKNAWNCFRIKEFYRMFPNTKFLWVRRNIADAAMSDLQTRYNAGDREVWSSATTSNWKQIQTLPYWQKVIEQQYYYNIVIEKALEQLPSSSYHTVWYEDLCKYTLYHTTRIGRIFGLHSTNNPVPVLKLSDPRRDLPIYDINRIIFFIGKDKPRFENHIYTEMQ